MQERGGRPIAIVPGFRCRLAMQIIYSSFHFGRMPLQNYYAMNRELRERADTRIGKKSCSNRYIRRPNCGIQVSRSALGVAKRVLHTLGKLLQAKHLLPQ